MYPLTRQAGERNRRTTSHPELTACQKGGAWNMDELTPDELDELLAFEAERREQEERKFELLYRLERLPAEDPLWEDLARRLGMRL
ncbi:hypothetical protein [Anaerolinea thermophila]|uniref:Uncharacterized protein n=1 Tax=Anaerolinea thermophila (strain DSM 14523 / JCM 11388 / NBRC 100420 / UNI-1) TaxID=926569 RepID=E8MXY2_ANATU|nr:hypothetical protein [Anaerolinea thermophila]BAJ64213.1 hypothetical protein ANT_21870 [Anaerolinea thermophila UNI-1]